MSLSYTRLAPDIINQLHLVPGARFHLAGIWPNGGLGCPILHYHKTLCLFTFVLVFSILIIKAYFFVMLHCTYIANSFNFWFKLCVFYYSLVYLKLFLTMAEQIDTKIVHPWPSLIFTFPLQVLSNIFVSRRLPRLFSVSFS